MTTEGEVDMGLIEGMATGGIITTKRYALLDGITDTATGNITGMADSNKRAIIINGIFKDITTAVN